jgi:hypothetical protein
MFSKGVIADSRLDGRSVEGKYARRLEKELLEGVSSTPTVVQKLMVRQAVRIQLQINALGAKLSEGNFTDHDRRVLGALHNAFRLTLRELGIKPAEPSQVSFVQSLAEDMAGR